MRTLLLPINKTAALVTQKASANNKSGRKEMHEQDSFNPCKVIEIPRECKINRSFTDVTGFVIGRLKVIGYTRKPGMWLCKCSCGIYTKRKTKSILNPKNHLDRCGYCRDSLHRKRSQHHIKTGNDLPLSFFDI